jgi:hypothetical protein
VLNLQNPYNIANEDEDDRDEAKEDEYDYNIGVDGYVQ